MWESAAKPAAALGKERGGLGDWEVMRFMAMTRQPGNPTDSPSPQPHCSLAALPHHLAEPLMTSCKRGLAVRHGGPYWDSHPSPSPWWSGGVVPRYKSVLQGLHFPSRQPTWSCDEFSTAQLPKGLRGCQEVCVRQCPVLRTHSGMVLTMRTMKPGLKYRRRPLSAWKG